MLFFSEMENTENKDQRWGGEREERGCELLYPEIVVMDSGAGGSGFDFPARDSPALHWRPEGWTQRRDMGLRGLISVFWVVSPPTVTPVPSPMCPPPPHPPCVIGGGGLSRLGAGGAKGGKWFAHKV